MKKFNLKRLITWFMVSLAITQCCVMVLLMVTGNVNYLYAGVALLVAAVCSIILFSKYMND